MWPVQVTPPSLSLPLTCTHSEITLYAPFQFLQGIVYCIWSCSALEKMRKTPKTITLASIGLSPYENRFVRSLIDACAFQIYSHWVKRGEEQNRAALFENNPKQFSPLSSSSINVRLQNNSEIGRLPMHEQQLSGANITVMIAWCCVCVLPWIIIFFFPFSLFLFVWKSAVVTDLSLRRSVHQFINMCTIELMYSWNLEKAITCQCLVLFRVYI